MEIRKKIGKRIVERRRMKGLTQEGLANAIGMKRQSLSRIETGSISAGLDVLGRIAEALGSEIDFATKED
jgi:transcriptional regulator with XRE-family HTH domain